MLPGAFCILLISDLYLPALFQRLQVQQTVLSLSRELQNNYFQLFILVNSINSFLNRYIICYIALMKYPSISLDFPSAVITLLMTKLCNLVFQM